MPELDRNLLLALERGDPAARETVARRYAGPAFRYLLRLSGNPTLAEDLAQEVAVQLWRALPGRRFPNERALTAWVFTVAANAWRMHARRRSSGEVPLDDGLDEARDPAPGPAEEAVRGDLALRVRRAVALLPAPEREALLLKAFSDLRYAEIAAATGEPVGTVKWRISRAYARLRALLQPELGEPDGAADRPVPGPAPEGSPHHGSLQSTPPVPGPGAGPPGSLATSPPPALL